MTGTLLEHYAAEHSQRNAPLAARIRPRNLDEFIGQQHLIGPGKFLRTALEKDRLPSFILWGPPGTGKTTLAQIAALHTKAHFAKLSAVTSGVQDVRGVIDQATERLASGTRTILFLDEIHRFSKSQQDCLLPSVESGVITLIGATTENPSFEVISALLSRARVFILKPLSESSIQQIIQRALSALANNGTAPAIQQDAQQYLAKFANGDARAAVSAVEAAHAQAAGKPITLDIIAQVLQSQPAHYKAGESHYDSISAFIKSVRASDPDAALYYLARMLDAGEDPLFIARRIVILAAEDIGLANPSALPIAVAAQQALSFIGMPEGQIPLAEATIYLATSSKSNSALKGIKSAMQDARSTAAEPIPMHLRNAPTKLMKEIGYGAGYNYPHDHPNNFVNDRQHLPDALAGKQYYSPGSNPAEQKIAERLQNWRKARPKP